MIWLAILALALVAFAALTLVLKAPRDTYEMILAALLVGLAGYALQGSPGVPAAPHDVAPSPPGLAEALVSQRQALALTPTADDPLLIIADAYARHGQYQDAVAVLRTQITQHPDDGEAWLALANALVGHAEGALSPAARYAYARAAAAEPAAPGPPIFLGLALAGSGRLDEARQVWGDLLAHTPPNAPWRAALVDHLARLDSVLRARAGGVMR